MRLGALENSIAAVTPGATTRRDVSPSAAETFVEEMGAALVDANDSLNEAEAAARELSQGKGDVVDTMIALGRADVSLRMVVNLRNRMLESYQEIMRLQV